MVKQNETAKEHSKKVILIIIDSLLTQALEQGLRENLLPAFSFLIKNGYLEKEMISSFPTMSVAIDSTLITGTYPDRHRVPGLIWYDKQERRLINYGTGPMEIWRHGLNRVLHSSIIELNERHLSKETPTIYEQLAEQGCTSGSINGIMYRGSASHRMSFPWWMSAFTTLPKGLDVKGPDFMSFGSFLNPLKHKTSLSDGLTVRLGFNDDFAVDSARYLIGQQQLPDFLYMYMPDLDKPLHKQGPPGLELVMKSDRRLGRLLQSFGSPEEALRQAVFVVMGDSGVSQLQSGKKQALIRLDRLLQAYRLHLTGKEVTEETELVLAVNETMAYLYKLKGDLLFDDIARLLLKDERIDFAAWREGDWIRVVKAGSAGELRYRQGGELPDPYGQAWTVQGDYGVLGLGMDLGRLVYDRYPDGLKRLQAALHSHEGDYMVLSAKPGYELADKHSPSHHGGGAHGSLHKEDTLIPFIVSGTSLRPETNRIVDLKRYLLNLTGKGYIGRL
ncbi:alkaline phosphatase family protein [Paenibacillus gansuensis]|uniref:Alkaline phosphatase family protein n=1 Tax=Paenibacillus gansuensis TaxID=306542 RepID=A0ABW5PAV9_9BACL